MKNISVQNLLDHIDQKIKNNEVIDSVHKIKLITAHQIILQVLAEDF